MNHYKIIGPGITREFDVEDDEMINFHILKIEQFEKKVGMNHKEHVKTHLLKNEKQYLTPLTN